MSEPTKVIECGRCFDREASRYRVQVELARVVAELEHRVDQVKALQGKSTAQLEEIRALRREIAHLRHRDDHLTIAGGSMTGEVARG